MNISGFTSSPAVYSSEPSDSHQTMSDQTTVSPAKYQYSALEPGHIRLFRLVDPAARADSQGFHCIIHHVPISSPGSFTALSCKWGSPEEHSKMLVQSESGLPLDSIPLTKNLGNAVKTFKTPVPSKGKSSGSIRPVPIKMISTSVGNKLQLWARYTRLQRR
jgi:hypothetical protein